MKRGGAICKPILLSMMAFAFAPCLLAASDPFLTLDTVVQINGQLQFNLNGEDSVTYVIEGSSDLQNWTPVLTNSDQPATRTITVDGSQNFGFYRASRGPLPVFAGAITARSNISFSGTSFVIDSYDSSDTNLFPGGLYNTTNRQGHGDVALDEIAIIVGDAEIMGKLALTGDASILNVEFGPIGSIGDVPWVTGGNSGLESPAYFINDFRFCLPDVSVPFTSGTAVLPPGTGTTNTLSSGIYFYNGNFSIPNNAVLQVAASNYVVLYVTGNFTMQSAAAINIQLGGTLLLYVGGPSATLRQINSEGTDFNFQYYGLPGNTSLNLSGAAIYSGTVYAPEATVMMNSAGSGLGPIDFSGALVANYVSLFGHVSIHYDENLARSGPQR